MRNRKTALISILLCLILVAQFTGQLSPARADSNWLETATQDDVSAKIYALQEQYPDGMAWDNKTPNPGYRWVFPGSLWNMGGCAAFAAIVQDQAIGSYKDITPTWQKITRDCYSGGISECAAPYTWESLYPGDIIRFEGHSVIVAEKLDDKIVVAEGNVAGRVAWGRTISRTSIENSGLYVITRYNKTEKLMPYLDLPEKTNWAWLPVTWSILNDVADGVSPMYFMPKNDCTRGETIMFLWKVFGSPEPTQSARPFEDVPASAVYYKAVYWAYENGITSGTSATTFSPDMITTRAHALTFLWRAAGSPEPVTTECPFTDISEEKYYRRSVLWAYENDITYGTTSTTFSPSNTCTRAESVAFLYYAITRGAISN